MMMMKDVIYSLDCRAGFNVVSEEKEEEKKPRRTLFNWLFLKYSYPIKIRALFNIIIIYSYRTFADLIIPLVNEQPSFRVNFCQIFLFKN